MSDVQRRFKLPVDLTAAVDFHTAYMNWPTEPEDDDTRALASYGESVASQAEDAIKSRDDRIEELESEVADLRDRVSELENRP